MRTLLPYLLLVCLLQLSCKGKTGNLETETGIPHPDTSGGVTMVQNSNTSPAGNNSDTLTINSRSAVFFQPDSLQIENRKKEAGEANFRAGAGDYIYYINTSVDYLGKQALPVLDAKDMKYLRFVSANGVVKLVKLDTLPDLWGIYLFDPRNSPYYADIIEIEEEFKAYFKE